MSQKQKPRFLVDENISPLTVKYLKELKLNVIDLIELNKRGIKKGELVDKVSSRFEYRGPECVRGLLIWR